LKEDKNILILDEPTAQLDTETVKRFCNWIKSIKENRAVLMTSKDEKVLASADIIHFMEEGRIIKTIVPSEGYDADGEKEKKGGFFTNLTKSILNVIGG